MSIGCICVSLCFVLVIYFLLGIVIKSSYSYFLLGIAIKSSYPYFEGATTTFARKKSFSFLCSRFFSLLFVTIFPFSLSLIFIFLLSFFFLAASTLSPQKSKSCRTNHSFSEPTMSIFWDDDFLSVLRFAPTKILVWSSSSGLQGLFDFRFPAQPYFHLVFFNFVKASILNKT